MSTSVEAQALTVGTPAPDFNHVVATGGTPVSLSDYRGQYLVMVFYPKDATPGCTRQLCALRDDLAVLNGMDTQVIAVNPGSLESHERFVANQGYNFPILVDADKAISQAYGALKPEGGIQRTVYVVGPEGSIVYAEQGLPDDSVIMDAIKQHQG
ncbi:MAG: peroxiredoxin [Cyanobacteria bacterium HKST-UBA06]|nr:peroxiredoxin [Cyanobacteria bacterium HKST-UBA06]